MASMNKVILIGNLGQDPEIKRLQDGTPVANLSIATSESWRDKNTGERRERTQWHRIVVWGARDSEGLVKVIEQYLAKGDQIMVIGQLEHRKWEDRDGVTKYATEVVLKGFKAELQILRCKAWEKNGKQDTTAEAAPAGDGGKRAAADPAPMDDDIPF
jgi:single-strand DNA-binding protein